MTKEDWFALKECSIHMDLTEIVQTGKQLVAIQSKELCYGFLVLNEEVLLNEYLFHVLLFPLIV